MDALLIVHVLPDTEMYGVIYYLSLPWLHKSSVCLLDTMISKNITMISLSR